QMRDAVLTLGLAARADGHPDSDRRALELFHLVGDDDGTGGQAGDLDAHRPPPARAAILAAEGEIRAWPAMNASTARRSFGSTENRSSRSMSPERCGGSVGTTPVAAATASGNFAGWAVPSVTIGVGAFVWLAATERPTAVCGSDR